MKTGVEAGARTLTGAGIKAGAKKTAARRFD